MIFDSINESINKFWPYGEQGVPMPWNQTSWKAISNEVLNFEKIFSGIKNSIKGWSSTCAGSLPRIEFVNQYTGQFSEELFAEIWEKRLATLLTKEVSQDESKWLNYFFETS